MYNSPIRNNKLLQEAYQNGRRRALNEQGLGGYGPNYWNDPPPWCPRCYWVKGLGWHTPDGQRLPYPYNHPLPTPYRPDPFDPNHPDYVPPVVAPVDDDDDDSPDSPTTYPDLPPVDDPTDTPDIPDLPGENVVEEAYQKGYRQGLYEQYGQPTNPNQEIRKGGGMGGGMGGQAPSNPQLQTDNSGDLPPPMHWDTIYGTILGCPTCYPNPIPPAPASFDFSVFGAWLNELGQWNYIDANGLHYTWFWIEGDWYIWSS